MLVTLVFDTFGVKEDAKLNMLSEGFHESAKVLSLLYPCPQTDLLSALTELTASQYRLLVEHIGPWTGSSGDCGAAQLR